MSALVIETAPKAEPVPLEVVKSHLRVSTVADDELIEIYMQAARELFEISTGRSLINKGYRQSLDIFPYYIDSMYSGLAYPPANYTSNPRYASNQWNYSQMIKLMVSPLRQVSRISYVSTDMARHDLYPQLPSWQKVTEYEIGDEIVDPNGKLQTVTVVADAREDETNQSGAIAPTWSTTTGGTTTDGDLTWTCGGTYSGADFVVDADNDIPRVFPPAGQQWPAAAYVPNAVQIHFEAGVGDDGGAVPAAAKVAILHLCSNWYEYREPVTSPALSKIPHHLEDLIWSQRILDFAPTRG